MSEKALPALAKTSELELRVLLTPAEAMAEQQKLREVVKAYLEPELDYGKMPGTDKDTLFQSGAQKLCDIYQLYGDPLILEATEKWDSRFDGQLAPLFDYTIRSTIRSRGTDRIFGVGLGSCNSYEAKYLWRQSKPKCPSCGVEGLRKSKEEWGGGYYCDSKAGGCGASWKAVSTSKKQVSDHDVAVCYQIDKQEVGRIVNPDIASTKNTVLKMAAKRAFITGVIGATRSSGIFTVDVEDFLSEDDRRLPMPTQEMWNTLILSMAEQGVSDARGSLRAYCEDQKRKGLRMPAIYAAARQHYQEVCIDADYSTIFGAAEAEG